MFDLAKDLFDFLQSQSEILFPAFRLWLIRRREYTIFVSMCQLILARNLFICSRLRDKYQFFVLLSKRVLHCLTSCNLFHFKLGQLPQGDSA